MLSTDKLDKIYKATMADPDAMLRLADDIPPLEEEAQDYMTETI